MKTRELKFRVWDSTNNTWGNKVMLECNSRGSLLYLYDIKSVIQQFTGLKDKNGVQIYEGDILVSSNDGEDGCDIWAESDLGYAVVEMDLINGLSIKDNDGCFWAFNEEESVYSLRYLKVVGNIFENPELIK